MYFINFSKTHLINLYLEFKYYSTWNIMESYKFTTKHSNNKHGKTMKSWSSEIFQDVRRKSPVATDPERKQIIFLYHRLRSISWKRKCIAG